MTTQQTIGARLKQARRQLAARESRDVTQAEVGAAAGVSAVQVSRYESDLQEPSVGVVARLAAVLGVPAAWLAFGEQDHGKNGGASILLEPVEQPRPSTPEELARAERAAAEELARMRAAEASTKKTPKRRASGS